MNQGCLLDYFSRNQPTSTYQHINTLSHIKSTAVDNNFLNQI
jgi:hypothetical protein